MTNTNKLSTEQLGTLCHYVAKHQSAPVKRAGYGRSYFGEIWCAPRATRSQICELARASWRGRSASYLGDLRLGTA